MFRHTLGNLARNDTNVRYERFISWSKNMDGNHWLSVVSADYIEQCEKVGTTQEATKWHTSFQTLIDNQFSDHDAVRNFYRKLEETTVAIAQDFCQQQLTVQSYDRGSWQQVGMPRARCSFYSSGLHFAVWPTKKIAGVYAHGFAIAAMQTNAPCSVLITVRGVTMTATTLVPILTYGGVPMTVNIIKKARKVPKRMLLKKAFDGRWYAVQTFEDVPLWGHQAFHLGTTTNYNDASLITKERLFEVLAAIPDNEEDIVSELKVRGMPRRFLTAALPKVKSNDHKRQLLREIIARTCKNFLRLEIISNKLSQTDAVMHANRLMGSLGDEHTFQTVVFPLVAARHAEINEYKNILTPEDLGPMMGRLAQLARLKISNGQCLLIDPHFFVPLRVSRLAKYAPYEINCLEMVSKKERVHWIDMVEGIHNGLTAHKWSEVKTLWDRLAKESPPRSLLEDLFDTVRQTLYPHIRECPPSVLVWYNAQVKDFIGTGTPEYVLTTDLIAVASLENSQRVYAMLAWEQLLRDILATNDNDLMFHEYSRDAVLHWIDGCAAVTDISQSEAGVVSFRARSMFSTTSSNIHKVFKKLELYPNRSPEVAIFAIQFAINAARVLMPVNIPQCTRVIERAKVFADDAEAQGLAVTQWRKKIAELEAARDERILFNASIKIQRYARCAKLWQEKRLRSCELLQRCCRGLTKRLAVWEQFRPVLDRRVQRVQRVARAFVCRASFMGQFHKRLNYFRVLWRAHAILEKNMLRWAARSRASRLLLQKVGRGLHHRVRAYNLYFARKSDHFIRVIQPAGRGITERIRLYHLQRTVASTLIQSVGRGLHVRALMLQRLQTWQRLRARAVSMIRRQIFVQAKERAKTRIYTRQLQRVFHGYRSRLVEMSVAKHDHAVETHVDKVQRQFAAERLARVMRERYEHLTSAILVIQKAGRGLIRGRRMIAHSLFRRQYREAMLSHLLERVRRHEDDLINVRYYRHYHLNGTCPETSHRPTRGPVVEESAMCDQLTQRQRELVKLSHNARQVVQEVQQTKSELGSTVGPGGRSVGAWTTATQLNVKDTLEQIRAKNAVLRSEIQNLEKNLRFRASPSSRRPRPPPVTGVVSPKQRLVMAGASPTATLPLIPAAPTAASLTMSPSGGGVSRLRWAGTK
eukprot:PhM_4_TR13093/c0_g1_i1/m.5716